MASRPRAATPPAEHEVAAAVAAFERYAERLRRQSLAEEDCSSADPGVARGSDQAAAFIARSVEGKGRAAFAICTIAQ